MRFGAGHFDSPLFGYGKEREPMPKGQPLSKEQRERIYDLHTMGVNHADIAEQFGISTGTVSKCVSTQRKLNQGKRVSKVAEVVVAGDKKNGRLVSIGTNQYEGTCLIRGKMKRRTFTAINARNAETQWEKWCTTLRDEDEFIKMVERTPRHEADEHDVAPIAETVTNVSAEKTPLVIDMSEQPCPEVVTVGITGAREQSPTYLIWAKRPEPRCYGLYRTMETALDEIDRLNEVASFLGSEGAFEVEEVAWKG